MRKKSNVGEVWYDHAGNECYYRENGSLSVRTINKDRSRTIQSEKDVCDVNKIVAKFKTTGLMTNVRRDQPQFGDFSDVCDFQTAMIRTQEAEEAFMSLPALIRKRFSNDPAELLDFLGNEENRAEAISLGLIASPQDGKDPQGDVKPASQDAGQKPADPSST